MGFQKTLTALLSHLPKSRQTLLFSATQTQSVSDLARLSLKEPVKVGVEETLSEGATPKTLEQHYVLCELDKKLDVSLIRAKIGMVFQKPTPFPMSIYDNIAFGVKLFERLSRSEMDERVEWALKKAALWTEVKDKLGQSGSGLSGGQQQRLCIARGIAIKPEVLLLDEPCSALDPISTLAIEDLINDLKSDYTVVIVTHNMQQAARVSDRTGFFNLEATGRPGELVEFDTTQAIFNNPSQRATEDYISGRFG